MHRLAVLLGQTDRPADVIRMAQAALLTGYRSAALFANIATAHQALGDPFAAAAAAADALDHDPDDQALLDDLAPMLRAGGREPRLLRALRHQAAARARNPHDVLDLGILAASLGQYRVALPALQLASDMAPDSAEPWLNLATLHVMAGDLEAAARCAWRAADGGQLEAPALFLLAHLGPGLGDRARLRARITSALTASGGATSPRLHFAAARLREDDDDIAAAMAHYREGNGLVRASFAYDSARAAAAATGLAAMICAGALQPLPPDRSEGPAPIFIVGAPRTGSTLIEQLLGDQPGVALAGELVWLPRIVAHVLGRERRAFPHGLAQLSPEGRATIRRTYRATLAGRAEGAGVVVDKLPANILYAGLALALFPEARVLVTDRSAADTCLSIYRHLFTGTQQFAYDIRETADHVSACRHLAGALCSAYPDRVRTVHLDTLINDREQLTTDLLAFCAIRQAPAQERPHRLVQTASAIQVRQPLKRASTPRHTRFRPHFPELQSALEAAGLADTPC